MYGSSVGFDEVFYWSARYSNCRLERAGPPNQLFFPTQQSQKPRRKQQSLVGRRTARRKRRRDENDESYNEETEFQNQSNILQTNNDQNKKAELSDQSDPESDIEIQNENSKEKDHNANDRYYVQWQDNFVDNLSITNRKLRGCTESRATLNGILATNYHFLTVSSLFYMLSPTEYFEEHIISAKNKELIRAHEKEFTLGEFYCWLGVWFIISLNPGYMPSNFFHTKKEIFTGVVQKYQEYVCTTPNCTNRVRTYCKCYKSLVLCMECYAIHKNETTWMGESASEMSPKSDKNSPVASLRPRRICRST